MNTPHVADITNLVQTKLSKKDIDYITRAFLLAQSAHKNQVRASGEPYFYHLVETAKHLARYQMDVQTITAGLLHDIIEDTTTPESYIEEHFGSEMLFMIQSVTKLGKIKYRGAERHAESLRKFFLASAKDWRVIMIKLADRLHNLETLQYIRPDKQERIANESIEIYAPLANRLGIGKLKGEIEDAAFPFVHPKEYEEVKKILSEKADQNQVNLEKIKAELEKEFALNRIKVVAVDYRIKHTYSLWKKLRKHDNNIERIYDLVALRIVVKSVSDCYRVLGIIHQLWHPLPGRIKDYIALPKPNGYQSLHTTIFTGDGSVAEIQIRTEIMHNRAEFGIASHEEYKKDNENIREDPKFKWVHEFKNLHKDTPPDAKEYLDHLKVDTFSDRIFVFTPKGDVIDLPEGSSAIDFAYAIHSEIGDRMMQVKINNKIEKIYTKLNSNDIIEVITNKKSTPTSKWLDFTKTTIARKHINNYLKENSLLQKFLSFGKK
ncbi:MAG: bifunctional (p)ppGpp synthetase/guanosine-3',5'-bis(diphosphate) 3'-pyrophosphohydrolase [Candidatus Pacebacteria bacterium]|nr:bifunctional (p)ppGpp synthetase/guanosine-3',5'-bis(diphosphate) 3'-pyrophosphohydrolase [Candidatus Paceibacterota bacterium]